MSKQSSSLIAAPVDAIRATLAAFVEPADVAPMRARAAEIEARLVQIAVAYEANAVAVTSAAHIDRIDQYLLGGSDVRDERAVLAAEDTLARDALRSLNVRIDQSIGDARALHGASPALADPAAAQRQRVMDAATPLFDVLTESRDVSNAAAAQGATLAGALWVGNHLVALSTVAALIDDLAAVGVPVNSKVRHAARIASRRSAE